MNDKTQPTTIKEALIAELLSDLDVAIQKTDKVIQEAAKIEHSLTISAKALIVAGEKYKSTINTFTEETKEALSKHIEQETFSALSPIINELKQANKSLISSEVNKLKYQQKRNFIFLSSLLVLNIAVSLVIFFK